MGVLGLVNLAGQVLSLHLELLLGRVSVIKSTGKLILLLVGLNNQALGHLAVLLHVGTVAHGLLESSPGLSEVSLHTGLVLLRLGLVLVDGINLVAQLSHAVVVLLAESSKSSLMGNVSLIQVTLQLDQLTLTLLVQLNLGAGVGANLGKPGAKILQVPGQQGAVLLGLGAVVALNRQLLIQLVNTGNKLLDLLGVLGSEGSLILNLGGNGGNLLVLALHSLGELRVDTLQVRHSLLGQLEVTLNLPLLLLHISLALLLALKSILTLVEGLLKLTLDLVEVVAPVLHGLDVLLALLNGSFKVLDLIPQPAGIGSHLGTGILDAVDHVIFSLDAGVDSINLLLQVVGSSLQTVGLVNDILDGRGATLQSKNQLV